MDFTRFFGKAAPRIETIEASATVEEFYFNLDTALNTGPCIYVIDSMDALTTGEEQEKFAERKKAHAKGKDVSGSYGTAKAKQNSADLRVAVNRLAETGSILIVISQTRDNIGFGSQFNPKTRSGGKAMTFYATCELWFSVREAIKRTVRGKSREIGSVLQVRIKKNRERIQDLSISVNHFTNERKS